MLLGGLIPCAVSLDNGTSVLCTLGTRMDKLCNLVGWIEGGSVFTDVLVDEGIDDASYVMDIVGETEAIILEGDDDVIVGVVDDTKDVCVGDVDICGLLVGKAVVDVDVDGDVDGDNDEEC